MNAHAARFMSRPDITYVPFREDPQLRWGLVWRTEAEDARIRTLAQVGRELGTVTL
ncbi:hypothetical protein G6045_33450 [Streptomyces sp. YC504]|uniref:LysR family transcriptional regulator n=1 Tax=Streptomyces mesophilus TaxID=1775132 RepID=A0A6G4XUP6_9ACTN|nr:hypothetical protein [Streptomyces mesophilus]NGO80527.1 hypothetical protein [Streptomyces mesophilus]